VGIFYLCVEKILNYCCVLSVICNYKMFLLYEMTKEVRIDPCNLGQDRIEAITDELNKSLANRVMLDVGLCMSLWDILDIKTGVIYQGDGGVHSVVKFRYIVFRPFCDEIIVGKIKRCTPDGVQGELDGGGIIISLRS
jgi:DNA-directed RNA polymerase III subunit RPC8